MKKLILLLLTILSFSALYADNENEDFVSKENIKSIAELNKDGDYSLFNNDFENAIDSYGKALSLDKNNFEAHQGLGVAYYQIGEYLKSIEELELAIDISPDYISYLYLGMGYLEAKLYEQATDSLNKGLALMPDDQLLLYNLGLTHFQQKNYENAINHFNRVIDIDPYLSAADTYLYLAESYQSLNMTKEVYETYEKAMLVYPYNIDIKLNYALVLFYDGYPIDTIDILEQAENIDPLNKTVQIYLGISYYLTENFTKSIEKLSRFLISDSPDSSVYFYLGKAYEKIGNTDDALYVFKLGKEKFPEEQLFSDAMTTIQNQ